MNALITKKHETLRQKVRAFAEKEILPKITELNEKEVFEPEFVKQMGELGLLGMNAPAAYGGGGLDTLSYIIAVEEISRVDSSVGATLAAHNSLGIAPIVNWGTEEQKHKFIPELCQGKKLWAFALTEKNAGSDAKGVETQASEEKKSWTLNGEKIFITNSSSDISAGGNILAITGEKNGKKEYSVLLVERNSKGYEVERISGKFMWRSADNGIIKLNQVVVPKENLLGERGKGMKIMLHTLDGGRLSIAAMGLGLAQGAFEMAKNYAQKRKQFGKKIAEFQSVAFKLADMALKIENARNTLYNACWLKDQGQTYTMQAAMAKLYCSEIAKEVSDEAMQIFGAQGFLKENHIERFYRDQRLLQIGEGTSEILRMVISRNLLDG